MDNRIGVYQIRNVINNKVYIGSTGDSFSQRWLHHKSHLTRGVHHNNHLQRAWKKYGSSSFVFEPIEIVETIADVLPCEQRHLDRIVKTQCYNNAFVAGSNRGHQYTEESRKRLSIAKQKIHRIVAPDGKSMVIENMTKFAIERGLDFSAMCRVSRGELRQYKGWRHPVLGFQPKKNYEIGKKRRKLQGNNREYVRSHRNISAYVLATMFNCSPKTIYNCWQAKD